MKKHDLQPTDENIKHTFIRDTIGRNNDLVYFIKMIDSIDESYSIALDSYWGSGKTFFVKQVKMVLDAVTEDTFCKVEGETEVLSKWREISHNLHLKKHVPIYYDAWANDCDDDPIYSLVYQMILDTENNKGIKDKISFSDVLSVAGKITGAIAGFDPNDIADAFKKGDFLDTLRERKNIGKRIEEYIERLLPKGCDRLLIIIDELDRCNPEFAVKLLERIKHYFNNDKVTFLFSVNLIELQHTIKQHYGASFNAGLYLDRFFDFRIPLSNYNVDLLMAEQKYAYDGELKYRVAIAVHDYFQMQMRDYLKFISFSKRYIFPELYHTGIDVLRPTYDVISFLLLPFTWGLMIKDINKFNAFMSGNDDSELIKFLVSNKGNYTDGIIDALYVNKSSKETIDLSQQTDCQVVHEFYNFFFSKVKETKIGFCLLREYERKYFHNTVSQMSDRIYY